MLSETFAPCIDWTGIPVGWSCLPSIPNGIGIFPSFSRKNEFARRTGQLLKGNGMGESRKSIRILLRSRPADFAITQRKGNQQLRPSENLLQPMATPGYKRYRKREEPISFDCIASRPDTRLSGTDFIRAIRAIHYCSTPEAWISSYRKGRGNWL